MPAGLGRNLRNSSRPPSSEAIDKLAPRSRRRASGRRPGKQDGQSETTLRQRDDPDVVEHRLGRVVGSPCSASSHDHAEQRREHPPRAHYSGPRYFDIELMDPSYEVETAVPWTLI